MSEQHLTPNHVLALQQQLAQTTRHLRPSAYNGAPKAAAPCTKAQRPAPKASTCAHQPNTASLSRAAHLHLINRLAQTNSISMLILLSATFYLAVKFYAFGPVAITGWAILTGLCCLKALTRAHGFNSANPAIAARPFHWRICHQANLGVIGVAFGSFPLVYNALISANAHQALSSGQFIPSAFWAYGFIPIMAFLAALPQLTHRPALFALILPVFTFVGTNALIASLSIPAMGLIIIGFLTASAVLIALHQKIIKRAAYHYPRTQTDISHQRLPRRRSVALRKNTNQAVTKHPAKSSRKTRKTPSETDEKLRQYA